LEPHLITYSSILGNATHADFAEHLHDLEHKQQLDYVSLSSDDIQRRRLKVITSQNKSCGIALARDQSLYGGAILCLSQDYALVVRCIDVQWLRCVPVDTAAALELGYFAGNMHWAVRFNSAVLEIELKGPRADYIARLLPFVNSARISLLEDDD
jgi:urease accessory protein